MDAVCPGSPPAVYLGVKRHRGLGVVAGQTLPTKHVLGSDGYMLTLASRAMHLGSPCRTG